MMACRLIGAKLSPDPVLEYYWLDSWEHITVKLDQDMTIWNFSQENELRNVRQL